MWKRVAVKPLSFIFVFGEVKSEKLKIKVTTLRRRGGWKKSFPLGEELGEAVEGLGVGSLPCRSSGFAIRSFWV